MIVGLGTLIIFVLTQGWTNFADQIRLKNPATRWLSVESLNSWNFGTLSQRLDLNNWLTIIDRIDTNAALRYSLFAVLLIPLANKPTRRLGIAMVAATTITIGTFFNLYLVHDYYLVAVSAFVALLAGSSVEIVLDMSRVRNCVNLVKSALVIVIVAVNVGLGFPYWRSAYVDFPKSESELGQLSRRDQYAFVSFGGWNPLILYYADRKGMMLDARALDVEQLSSLQDLKKYDFYAGNPDRFDVIKLRGWWAPIGQTTTRLDDNLGDLKAGGVSVVFGRDVNSLVPTKTPYKRVIQCNGHDAFDLRSVEVGSMIYTTAKSSQHFSIDPNLQIAPVGDVIAITSPIPGEISGLLACGGGGSIELSW